MTDVTRTHLSNGIAPIRLRSLVQGLRTDRKPNGLWYEVDDDWKRWLVTEQYRLDHYTHEFDVEIGSANILVIGSVSALDEFSDVYGRPYEAARDRDYLSQIAWPLVAQEYDGIEIAPYRWERRLADSTAWYYGWDVASGCIWRPATDTRVIFKQMIDLRESASVE